jgi:hypothetical protein
MMYIWPNALDLTVLLPRLSTGGDNPQIARGRIKSTISEPGRRLREIGRSARWIESLPGESSFASRRPAWVDGFGVFIDEFTNRGLYIQTELVKTGDDISQYFTATNLIVRTQLVVTDRDWASIEEPAIFDTMEIRLLTIVLQAFRASVVQADALCERHSRFHTF